MSDDTYPGDSGRKLCVACFEELEPPVTLSALKHWLEKHPDDDRLHDVLTATWVQVDCEDCGQAFFSPVSYGIGRIAAEAYCPDCDEKELIRPMMVQEITAEELFQREIDPVEDSLDNRRVFDVEVNDER